MRLSTAAALLPLMLALTCPLPSRAQMPAAPEDSSSIRVDPLKFYGSVRIRYGVASGGYTEVADRFSRLGLRLPIQFSPGWTALTRVEFGLNIVNQNPQFLTGGDDGFAYGQGSMPVTTRLGYVEVASPYGTLSVGKQWGVYYDIAGWTDNYPQWGGEAAGAYPTGDGGIQGTGRAEKAIQYRVTLGPVGIGLQSQARNYSPDNKKVLNTWSARVDCALPWNLVLGAAYNEVRDGVDDPGSDKPKKDDKALVLGAKYDIGRFFAAATYASSNNHEKNDQDQYFAADGMELYLHYDLDDRWFVYGGLNYLKPKNTDESDYCILYGDGGVAYRLSGLAKGPIGATGNSCLFVELRADGSRTVAGSALRKSIVLIGINVGW